MPNRSNGESEFVHKPSRHGPVFLSWHRVPLDAAYLKPASVSAPASRRVLCTQGGDNQPAEFERIGTGRRTCTRPGTPAVGMSSAAGYRLPFMNFCAAQACRRRQVPVTGSAKGARPG